MPSKMATTGDTSIGGVTSSKACFGRHFDGSAFLFLLAATFAIGFAKSRIVVHGGISFQTLQFQTRASMLHLLQLRLAHQQQRKVGWCTNQWTMWLLVAIANVAAKAKGRVELRKSRLKTAWIGVLRPMGASTATSGRRTAAVTWLEQVRPAHQAKR